MRYPENYSVIIIGGGHAGTEAALASARMGVKTLLLTHNIDTLGQMSCNPAIGGIGKGHLVKEIDALGGAMAKAIDRAGIQFRTLNASKGPAVRATRAQADRALYKSAIREILENQENLSIFQNAVVDLIVENEGAAQRVIGVKTQMGLDFYADAVVLTVGTFLGGKIHIGTENHSGGRAGDPPSIALADRATRAQADRALYKSAIREILENQENLSIFQNAVVDLIVENEGAAQKVIGVKTQMGLDFYADAVVLTVGTFLGGKIHIGTENHSGGRAGDPPSIALADRLRELPFRVDRLKTGTPPRIDAKSVDFSQLEQQPGDTPVPTFSFMGDVSQHPEQISCWITHTSEKTHDIIRGGLDRSPMYSGEIEGVGPRYCPSIEDKVMRFSDKTSHQIFVEPEGLNTHELYPNGISTSLPFDVQMDFVRSIKGFENAHITRPGYAIEYDFFDPRDLKASLETKFINGLYFAGQINGTTGYEEAGAQGLIAGMNAALQTQGKDSWSPRRDEAYIGVLIDDLITRGTQEPYRMFTSRAEYRLILREDNADLRLTERGRQLGLVDEARWVAFNQKREAIDSELKRISKLVITPESQAAQALNKVLEKPLSRAYKAEELLRRPDVSYDLLMEQPELGPKAEDAKVAEQVQIQTKYSGYIDRQKDEIERNLRNEHTELPSDMDYTQVKGLSNEVAQKLQNLKPETIGQASRISGVTPAAISLLLVYLKKRKHLKSA